MQGQIGVCHLRIKTIVPRKHGHDSPWMQSCCCGLGRTRGASKTVNLLYSLLTSMRYSLRAHPQMPYLCAHEIERCVYVCMYVLAHRGPVQCSSTCTGSLLVCIVGKHNAHVDEVPALHGAGYLAPTCPPMQCRR